MKIAFHTPSWPGNRTPNGITSVTVELTRGLEDLGHDVSIITSKSEVKAPNVFVKPAPRTTKLYERIAFRLGYQGSQFERGADQIATATEAAISARGIEILLMEETQGIAGLVQKKLKIPVVVVLHGPWYILGRIESAASSRSLSDAQRIERELNGIRACAAVISPSRDVLNLIDQACGLGGKPRAVIPNPISLKSKIDYDALDEAGRRSILFVGRFDRTKGGDLVLEAFTHLIGEGADARLTFVGPDRGIVPSGTRASSAGIESVLSRLPEFVRARVTYLGLRSKTEVDDLRRHHLAAIVTSRYENFPTTVTESMATGAATIATSVGGIPEIIQHGRNGLLASSEDPVSLATQCVRLLQNPEQAKRLGKQARIDVAERLCPTAIGQKLVDFLEGVRW